MHEKVLLLQGELKREPGWFYYIDRQGDISRALQNRTGRKPKKKKQ
jgi:hypothetical protein